MTGRKFTFFILLFTTLWGESNIFAQNATSSLTYLTLDATPLDIALSGAGAATPGRTEGLLTNPALLSSAEYSPTVVPYSGYFATRPFFFNEFRNNLLLGRFSLYGFDFGAYAQIVNSDAVRILDDLGDQVGFQQIGFFSGGLSFSYRFTGRENFFVTGTTLKAWQSQLAEYRASGVAMDVGGIFYFTLPRPGILPYVSNMPDNSVAVTIKNIGTPATYIADTEPSPLSYDITLRNGIYAFRMHQIDLVQAFHHFVVFDSMRYSFGAEYVLFGVVYFRASLGYNITHFDTSGTTSFAMGGGLKDRRFENFGYSLDYAFSQNRLEGGSHVFGIGLIYFVPLPPQPVRVNVELDLEIIAEAQRVVQDVKIKKGRVPSTRLELYQEMKDRGYPEPRLTAGRLVYLPELEQVLYVRNTEDAEKVYLLTLKDGSALLGNITKSDDDRIVILTSIGPVTVPVKNVERIVSSEFAKMDDVAKLRVQFLVLEYKKKEGKLPADLEELARYAAGMGWLMPSPVTQQLSYNPRTGEVTLTPTETAPPKSLPEQKSEEKPLDPTEIIDPIKKGQGVIKESEQVLPGE